MRTSRFGLALKRFNQIKAHFFEFVEDLIDFHAYAGRKQTLRSYVDLIRKFGNIYAHKYYVKAAKAAITTHLIIYAGGEAAEMMVDGVSLGKKSPYFSWFIGIGKKEGKKQSEKIWSKIQERNFRSYREKWEAVGYRSVWR
jgi:NMDA receptor-regulated protein 1